MLLQTKRQSVLEPCHIGLWNASCSASESGRLTAPNVDILRLLFKSTQVYITMSMSSLVSEFFYCYQNEPQHVGVIQNNSS